MSFSRPAVGRGLAHLDSELVLERLLDALVARHPIDDVVGEPDHELALGLAREEGVEADEALHLHPGHTDLPRDEVHRLAGDASELRLDGSRDVDQAARVVAVLAAGFLHGGLDFLGHESPCGTGVNLEGT